MKASSIIKLIIFSFLLLPAQSEASNATGNVETAEFKVEGVCGMCEKRIENAALIKGVKMAEWDKETKILKVIYQPQKVTLAQIHKAVAESGHTTDKVRADAEIYSQLPKCCLYEDGVHQH